jgi:hypothetical protein
MSQHPLVSIPLPKPFIKEAGRGDKGIWSKEFLMFLTVESARFGRGDRGRSQPDQVA